MILIIQVIKQNWNVQLKDSRIYEIISELNLSYQKGHRDYANADKVKQKQYSFIEIEIFTSSAFEYNNRSNRTEIKRLFLISSTSNTKAN